MNELVYKNFYDRCGNLNGWDFSKVRSASEGAKWDFYHEVSQRCKKSDILLDIGTAGGEALLSIAEVALLLVGIDISVGMLDAASVNLESSRISNVRILQMDSDKIDFPNGFFNIVSSRHAPINAEEVARVLVDDGIFLTQQVSEDDKINIKQAFERGQLFGIQDGTLKNKYITELREAGFHDIQGFDYDVTEWYKSYEDLIFLLKHTPIIPNFGQSENDFALLEKFIGKHQTNKGIMTNSKRFMIIARK
ncbi:MULTISPECIES: class I SAM-dependent methyltransferase [unclassified Paenibacillus]|uniref:class I SAM-dependent methyltransferase n=1 Tax=unclassified Paenibacillus TaxID=185978 RepID=UPI00277FE6F8|nr:MULTISPECIES: class I SAM-dependent methyltransferase [unclassified Paenibacillus]MDQ0896185.1 SAM-dependent methyltransferase [Paenibacillus sp. V4I7]MDQ0913999.1 SAM-dependent methyltransferase [Paenibacillus sp. V4I5]